MKATSYFIFVLSFLLILLSCSDDSDILSPIAEFKYRSIAYKSLTDQQKESITHAWQDAYVEQGNYQTGKYSPHFIVINSNHKLGFSLIDENTRIDLDQSLIAVSFGTKDAILLGPITVIINPKKENVIGFVGRN